MIRTEGLCVTLGGKTVLRDATLSFSRGRVTAVLGPNGAGKTSLVRALAGIIKGTVPFSGVGTVSKMTVPSVTLDDTPLTSLSLAERARRIGYLPQDGAPAWNVTVRELVALGRLPHRSSVAGEGDGDRAAIDAALTATDTEHLAERGVDTLSGGERARAKIARVLAGEPDWILADEPLANLDPPHQRDVLALFRHAAAAGSGVIVVLHQLNAAMRVADDVVLLRDGAVLAAGARDDVMTPALLEDAFGMGFEVVRDGERGVIVPR